MSALIPARIPAENILSDRFRIHAVMGDAMEPTLRGNRDYALIAPVTQYCGEGLYLVDVGSGVDIFRVRNSFDGKGGLLLFQENRQEEYPISLEEFEALVVGIVVADIKPRDERFLRAARNG
ncbi:hypothetical protein EHS39_23735 [Ensifer sp. MPMI2T]|nr:hypothetical protein EHS39_23735 [Ensifer sp. MPMI2T]